MLVSLYIYDVYNNFLVGNYGLTLTIAWGCVCLQELKAAMQRDNEACMQGL